MEYATIWKQPKSVGGFKIEVRSTFDFSKQPVPTFTVVAKDKREARTMVAALGAILWN